MLRPGCLALPTLGQLLLGIPARPTASPLRYAAGLCGIDDEPGGSRHQRPHSAVSLQRRLPQSPPPPAPIPCSRVRLSPEAPGTSSREATKPTTTLPSPGGCDERAVNHRQIVRRFDVSREAIALELPQRAKPQCSNPSEHRSEERRVGKECRPRWTPDRSQTRTVRNRHVQRCI